MPMRIGGAFMLLVVVSCHSHQPVTLHERGLLTLEGVFSNLRVGQGGELSGMEVRLFPGGKSYQAVVLFGEGRGLSKGSIGDAVLGTEWPLGVPIPPNEAGREKLAFSFSGERAGSFIGYIYADRLEGEVTIAGEGSKTVLLARQVCEH